MGEGNGSEEFQEAELIEGWGGGEGAGRGLEGRAGAYCRCADEEPLDAAVVAQHGCVEQL